MTASKLNTPQPKIFIGSSKEALDIANSVKIELLHYADAYLWREDNIFGVGDVTIESLEEVVQRIPYAIFVMSPDDITIERKKKYPTPRDNLVFESVYGLVSTVVTRSL